MAIQENKFNKEAGQFIKITFEQTGDDGTCMPNKLNTEISQITAAQLFLAATELMRKAYKELEGENGMNVTDMVSNSLMARKAIFNITDKIEDIVKQADKKEDNDGKDKDTDDRNQ